MKRDLPQSVVDYLAERLNQPKPPKPYKSLTDDELRALYGQRDDAPTQPPRPPEVEF